MDDLTLVREHGDEFGPGQLYPPPAVTRQVLTTFRTQTGQRPGSSRLRLASRTVPLPRRGAGRQLLWLAPAAAAAALVLVATGLLPLGGRSTAGPPTAAQPGRPAPGEVTLDARSILLAAAAQARAESATVPDAGHYVYSRSTMQSEGPGTADGPVTTDAETWLPVDGQRRGLEVVTMTQAGKELGPPISFSRPACPPTRPAPGQDAYCSGSGYVTDIPQDPAGALAVLRNPGKSLGWTSNPFCQTQPDCATTGDVSVFLGAATALTQRLMPAGSRAAVFEGLSTLSGTAVLRDATAGGRSGVGLVVEDPASPSQGDSHGTIKVLLVFDRSRHDLVGFRLDIRSADGTGPVVIDAAAGSQQVVQELGSRPDGTRIAASLLSS